MSVLDRMTEDKMDLISSALDKLAANIDPSKSLPDILTDEERHAVKELAGETLQADGLPTTAWKSTGEPWGVAV